MSGDSVVWLVTGASGEYENRVTWTVAVYTTEEQAQAHAEAANQRLRELGINYRSGMRWVKITNFEYDPQLFSNLEWTGAEYAVVAIPFVRHLDEFLERIRV